MRHDQAYKADNTRRGDGCADREADAQHHKPLQSYRIDPHGPGRRFPQCQGVERPCGDGEYGHAQAHDWQRQAHIVPTSVRQRTHQPGNDLRSEEHTSELQSLMRTSYAVFCLKKKKHSYLTQALENSPYYRPLAHTLKVSV